MLSQLNRLPLHSSPQPNSCLFLIVCMVVVLHALLLGMGALWQSAPPPPKTHSKVIVQTVQLKPFQSTTKPSQSFPPLPSSTVVDAPKNESIPIRQTEEIEIEKVEIKEESKPDPIPSSPKPIAQEPPKATTKQPAPAKKAVEPAKKSTKNEPQKVKQDQEKAKKKRQQEQAEKKQQEKKEAEKKQQQQKAEAEKKRQQEAAEVKKKQQEIAAAQEIALQKQVALQEKLAKVSKTRAQMSSTPSSIRLDSTAIPKQIGSLHVDALPFGDTTQTGTWGAKEISYSDQIAYLLKTMLRLPDYGAVKIKLTLDRTGKVLKVETTQSESSKNKTYVESKIPTILFPSFGQQFQGASQNTFVITLQNDS